MEIFEATKCSYMLSFSIVYLNSPYFRFSGNGNIVTLAVEGVYAYTNMESSKKHGGGGFIIQKEEQG